MVPTWTTETGGSTVPRCSASQTRFHRLRVARPAGNPDRTAWPCWVRPWRRSRRALSRARDDRRMRRGVATYLGRRRPDVRSRRSRGEAGRPARRADALGRHGRMLARPPSCSTRSSTCGQGPRAARSARFGSLGSARRALHTLGATDRRSGAIRSRSSPPRSVEAPRPSRSSTPSLGQTNTALLSMPSRRDLKYPGASPTVALV